MERIECRLRSVGSAAERVRGMGTYRLARPVHGTYFVAACAMVEEVAQM